jgi:hypothetical protein
VKAPRASVAEVSDTPEEDAELAPEGEGVTEESVAAAAPKKPATPPVPRLTKPMQEIKLGEDQALKDYLDMLGPDGSIRVRINREAPKTVRVNGRDYPTAGHLDTVNECIDEEWLREQYGGGTYKLTITSRRQTEGGSFKYAGHRQVVVAGDPKIEKLPTNAVAATPSGPAPAPESAGMVKEVMGLLKDELGHAREAKPQGIDPAVQMVIDQLRDDAKRRDAQMDKLQQQLDQARHQKPPEDPFREKMLDKLIDGDSARVTALRAQHESELRAAKDGHVQEVRLIEDRHDRTIKQMQQTHELMLAGMKASYEREIAALNASHQATATANTATKEVTVVTLNAEIKRLERDNDELRKDNRDLREKKDKPLIEQLKDMKTLKEAFSDGEEGDGSASTIREIAGMIPSAIEGIGGIMASRSAAQQQPQQVQARAAAQAQQQRPRVVAAPNGERLMQVGNKLVPVKPKPKVVTTDAGETIEIPKIEEPTLRLIISQLEAAFGRDEDPNIVAQSAKAMIPPDILAWILQHHTEQVSGVDLFMQKVAKLPGSSPLATQGGRNWLRRVGAILIGERTT